MSILPLARYSVDVKKRFYLADGVYCFDFSDLDIALPSQFVGNGGLKQDNRGGSFVLTSNIGSYERLHFDAADGAGVLLIWYFEGKLKCYVRKGGDDNIRVILRGKKDPANYGDYIVYDLTF